MIELTSGNLLAADVEALVNTVNTVGVMGKGIALQFKKAFPENFSRYRRAVAAGEIEPGKMFAFETGALGNPRFIFNFPTKRHWKDGSRIEDIDAGLEALIREVRRRGIRSIAVPPLGCGNGGLDWNDVLPRIERAFAAMPEVRVLVYEPVGSPSPREVIDCTDCPPMTPGRAVVLCLMNRYFVPGYDYSLSMLEIQKLAYFMQSAGEALKLRFAKGPFGPYADNLRRVLATIDGHFIRGYGDGTDANRPETPIELIDDAAAQAERHLNGQAETQRRLERVSDLIEGFETPFGMELLSSVHWIAAAERPEAQSDFNPAVEGVRAWSSRKRRLMLPGHVQAAWQRLAEQGWFPLSP